MLEAKQTVCWFFFTSREFLSTAMWTMPSLSLHFSRTACWMTLSQCSPTSLFGPDPHSKRQYRKRDKRKWTNEQITLHQLTRPRRKYSSYNYMTGSNMFLIFRQGVKLLGGEFLRSSGNAREPGRTIKSINELIRFICSLIKSHKCSLRSYSCIL